MFRFDFNNRETNKKVSSSNWADTFDKKGRLYGLDPKGYRHLNLGA